MASRGGAGKAKYGTATAATGSNSQRSKPQERHEVFCAVQQNLTHQHILDVGGRALDNVMQQKEQEKEDAVRHAVEQAEAAASQHLSEALVAAKRETEQQIKAIREELCREKQDAVLEMKKETTQLMEGVMALEMTKAAENAAQAQTHALEQAGRAARIACDKAVEEARSEEQGHASLRAEELAAETKAILENTVLAKEEERRMAIAQLTSEMLAAQKAACDQTRSTEGQAWQDRMDAQAAKHQSQVAELKEELESEAESKRRLDHDFKETQRNLSELTEKHDDFMTEYKRFVDSIPKLSSGFLL